MPTSNRTQKSNNPWEFPFDDTIRWVNTITYAVAEAVTSAVTAVVTGVTIVIVILAGLWLAYTYLPANVFTTIVAVLVTDILLGIALRAFLKRR